MKNIARLFVVLLFVSCGQNPRLFNELTVDQSGVDFENTLTESDDFNILDYLYFYNGGGVAVGDVNNDGLPDIFFSGNQVENKLFLNKGDLRFDDITTSAGIVKNSDWNTGSVMGDFNGDGFLDIYVCAVVGLKGMVGYNELYINNGDLTFTESASKYGLDFDTYSSSVALLDYDLDGDLDMYLLNHAVHTQESFGNINLRYRRNYETGDRLLRNDSLKFVDVSEEAGIFGGVNGYGLGLAIADFDSNGYPDIFVGNDFHEDDYYYLNNGDGTFTESLREAFNYSSRFSMGNDVSDINHDGFPDLISLDMLAEEETVLKRSEGDENYNIMRLRNEQYGYYYQFSRNMLNINQPNGKFMETALLSGVEATDWSWSALIADYDLDGHQDIYISNGIPKRPNDLDFIKFVSGDQIKTTINTTKIVDQKALDMMPDGAVSNYAFKGDGNLKFENVSNQWLSQSKTYSTASAIADLDNDGDLDIVTNNVNSPATISINQSKEQNFLKIRLNYVANNPFGIGTKVYSYHDGIQQFKELYTARGFQASSEPVIHFGYGGRTSVDSLRIVWPDGQTLLIGETQTNKELVFAPTDSGAKLMPASDASKKPFKKVNLLSHAHKEDRYVNFDRQKLMPFQASDRGPAMAIGDLNRDGLDDLFIGSSKFEKSLIFLQEDSSFVQKDFSVFENLAFKEMVDAAIGDFDLDGNNDLIIASGGADFFGKSKALTNSLLFNDGENFVEKALPKTFENNSTVQPFDFDKDGDLDIFIGSHSITGDYGALTDSYLLINEDGAYSVSDDPVFNSLGMVTDALWTDFDQDGDSDLIVVGEWMPPVFLENNITHFVKVNTGVNEKGLWQSIASFDIDQDGDEDYVLGNWGLNSKFKGDHRYPLRMYYSDFDENGSSETIIATAKNGEYYPLESFDELASQLVELRKKYTLYKDFAGQAVGQVFELDEATLFEVNQLASGYLLNQEEGFTFVPFNPEMQLAPIMDFATMDTDGDGARELVAVGNYFGVKPFQGRLASFPGAVIKNREEITLGSSLGLELTGKSARKVGAISFRGKQYLVVALNDSGVEMYEMTKLDND